MRRIGTSARRNVGTTEQLYDGTTREMGGALAPPFEHLVYICAGSGWRGVSAFCRLGGSLGPGAEFMNFDNFQGSEHVKHEGFGLSEGGNSLKINETSV